MSSAIIDVNRPAPISKWDHRFLQLAKTVSEWSKDPSTRCGAVIVRPDKTVASMGFNGFPRGCQDDAELYADRDLKYSRVIHAEVNAVLNAYERVQGYTLYSWPPGMAPTCDRCATVVIQSGIARVVYCYQENEFAKRWQPERALKMYREAGVTVSAYPLDFIFPPPVELLSGCDDCDDLEGCGC